jgi:hypothetical protein
MTRPEYRYNSVLFRRYFRIAAKPAIPPLKLQAAGKALLALSIRQLKAFWPLGEPLTGGAEPKTVSGLPCDTATAN